MNTMEDFTKVRIRGLFDDSTEDLPVARTVEHGIFTVASGIFYLEDGRYIKGSKREGRFFLELRNEKDELIKQIPNMDNAHIKENKGTQMMYSSRDTHYILDVDTGETEAVELDPPKLISRYYFGPDRDTLFCISPYDIDIYKLHYVKATKKWTVARKFEVIRHVGGIGGTGKITKLMFDGQETLFISVRYPIEMDMDDDEEEPGNPHVGYSINITTGNMKRLFKFDNSEGTSFVKLLTPSALIVRNTDFRGETKIYVFDLIKNILSESNMKIDGTCFTPDGRGFVDRLDPRSYFGMLGISPNGQRMNKIIPSSPFFLEYVLGSPMLRPVYTHIYGDHHWIRLMSDMTIETSETFPALGFPIPTTPVGMREAVRRVRERDENADFTMPIAIWSYSDREGTFEKAKRVYLKALVRAIAKEMITK